MKTVRFFRLLVLRVVILTIIAMVWNFITELLDISGFFGDHLARRYSWSDYEIVWGWRHYAWNIMSIILLAISIVRICVWGDWYWTQIKRADDVDRNAPENKLF
jgi:hypothetical protein